MKRHHILAELRTADHGFIRQLLPSSTDCVLRYNQAATAHMVVDGAHPVVEQLTGGDARGAVWMITVDGAVMVKRKLLEGPVGRLSGQGPFGQVTIPIVDDFEWITGLRAWPNPTAGIDAQVDDAAHITGPSETRVLSLLAAAVTRLGLPIDVAASGGRGTVGTTDMRFDPVSAALEALTADHLRLRVVRNATTNRWAVDVVAETVYPRPLTPQSGLMTSWNWALEPATMTRVVVGGAGSGADREFAYVIDSAREARLGRVLEGFVEASNAETGAELAQYGLDVLAAAGEKASVAAELRESSWFRFPDTYDLDTGITIQADALTATDVVSEITVSHNKQSGFTVTPKVGFAESDPQARLVGFVTGLASSVRSLERR